MLLCFAISSELNLLFTSVFKEKIQIKYLFAQSYWIFFCLFFCRGRSFSLATSNWGLIGDFMLILRIDDIKVMIYKDFHI